MNSIKTILATAAILTAGAAVAAEVPANVYMIGSATSAKWEADKAIKMTKEGNTFTFEGVLYGGNKSELKFLTGKDFGSYTFYATAAGSEIKTAGIENQIVSYHQGDPDNKWVVETTGTYKVTLVVANEPTNENGGTLTVSCLGEPLSEIYMLGAAVDRWGNSSEGLPVYGKDGIYTWTGDLNFYNEDKLFKFALTKGNWNEVTYIVPTETNLNGNVLKIEAGKPYAYQESREDNGGLKDWFWGINEGQSGRYKITVNTNDKTVALELLKSYYSFNPNDVTELYMLGLAAGSFDSNNPVPMTAKEGENGVFTWSGHLDYNTNDGDANHANKQFKFVTPTGDWDKVFYLVPTGAEADGYIQEVTPGTYDLKMTTWTDGRTGVDAFFGLTSGQSGNYTITVNVPEMKFEISKNVSDGVEAIAADNADEVMYDLNGRVVARQNAATGIYVVRKNGKASKVVIR